MNLHVILPREVSQGDTVMNVCVIMERDSQKVTVNYDKLAAAIDLALNYVEEEVLVDTGITLRHIYRDAGRICGTNHIAARAALKLFTDGIECDAYLGPGCVDAASDICNIASYRNTPAFAIPAGSLVSTSAPRSLFPQLIRMSYQVSKVTVVIVEALRHLSFKHTFCIVDYSTGFYQALGEALFDLFRVSEPEFLRYSHFVYVDTNDTDSVYLEHLKTAQKYARAVLLLTNGLLTRRLMIMAKDCGMTHGDYIYFAVELFESNSWGILSPAGTDGRDADAASAFRSLLVISLEDRKSRYWDGFQTSFFVRATSVYNYSFVQDGKVASIMNPMVTAVFDGVVLYANALRAVHTLGQSVREPAHVLTALRGKTYFSPLTVEIIIDAEGDRVVSYAVSEIFGGDQYNTVMELNHSSGGLLYDGNLTWVGGFAPMDVPYCGYLGQEPRCRDHTSSAIAIGAALALFGIFLTAMATSIYIKWRKTQDPFWWRISFEDLDFSSKDIKAELNAGKLQGSGTISVRSDGELIPKRFNYQKAELHGVHLAVIRLPSQCCRPSARLLKELNMLRTVHHPNLVRFVGICLGEQNFCFYLLEEFCEKGPLTALMANDAVDLDAVFKNSFIKDIIEGMAFLHSGPVVSHGFLTSACCMVNSKFTVKLDDYGTTQFREAVEFLPPKLTDKADRCSADCSYLWRAPELLRDIMPPKGTPKGTRLFGLAIRLHLRRRLYQHCTAGDVYSFGMVMQEIICRSGPFLLPLGLDGVNALTLKELIMEVKRGVIPPCRPKVPASACAPSMYELLQHCWEEEPEDRPTFAQLRDTLKKNRTGGKSIVDHLLERMEEYSNELELEVARKTDQFKAEKARSDNLLKNMLPKATAEALTRGETITPESFSSVTIFFSDIVGFADICSRISPLDVLEALNSVYHWSDTIMEKYDVYKVEAIADIFMVASGLPIRNENRHVTIMASLALELKGKVTGIRIPNQSSDSLQMRLGMHSGPCVAGIVGLKMPRYCLFGDSVNTASRMQSHGEVNKIHLSQSAAELLTLASDAFLLERRGETMIKGKGMMTTFWLTGVISPQPQ
ncbi:Atrial natriuretic peptide receptor 1 [Hypsibius exemplaris]|uniref:guanylate cyclase n=1 Tax=Hypsibius exemplaris TaxID=2072580 RepID=A0A1W0WUU7_HYPEX|nr:Atrial natriuretic peptide receptor 1 [Hypsibius exemplaris]